MIFDTHAHYTDARFDEDREELLAGMKARGVGEIVEVGASIQSTKDAVNLAESHDNIYAAVGVHPEDIERLTPEDMQWLADLTHRDKVVAIGEIGLDYYYDEPGRDLQKKWFARQLQVAAETQMPVIIHSRDAAKDTLDMMKAAKAGDIGGVVHCFSYTREMAREYLNMGFFLGIGGVLTFNNARKLKEVVEYIPLESIVLETDCPYLAPVPNRGKRNSSLNLPYVVEAVSQLKGVDPETVVKVTWENGKRLYRL